MSDRISDPAWLLTQIEAADYGCVHSKTVVDCPDCIARVARFALRDLIELRRERDEFMDLAQEVLEVLDDLCAALAVEAISERAIRSRDRALAVLDAAGTSVVPARYQREVALSSPQKVIKRLEAQVAELQAVKRAARKIADNPPIMFPPADCTNHCNDGPCDCSGVARVPDDIAALRTALASSTGEERQPLPGGDQDEDSSQSPVGAA